MRCSGRRDSGSLPRCPSTLAAQRTGKTIGGRLSGGKAATIRIARQSEWEDVLPREPMFLSSVPLPHQNGPGDQAAGNALLAGVAGCEAEPRRNQVDVASAGQFQTRDNGLSAPLTVRVVYRRGPQMQVRQATVRCMLNAKREAVALL